MPLLVLRLALAATLVVIGSLVVLAWLALLTVAYAFKGTLFPWVSAGLVTYGFAFIVVACLVGVPGIVWADLIAKRAPSPWNSWARVFRLAGIVVLSFGFASVAAVLVYEGLSAEPPKSATAVPSTVSPFTHGAGMSPISAECRSAA